MALLSRVALMTATSALCVVGVGGSTASAGEVTGNGKEKTVKAKSICAFSGQNDGFHDPTHAEGPEDAAMRVQSYGQVRRTGAEVPPFLHPGSACNGHTGFLSGP